jgi:hypothetical protein
MTSEQEQKLKAMAEQQQYMSAGATLGGQIATPMVDEPSRASLRERVAMDLGRARRESRKLDRLSELEYLLGKNPEIARILDLIEDVRG